jgi:hypothetical protein
MDIMLMTTHQLVIVLLRKRKVESNVLVGYVKEVIKLTFFPRMDEASCLLEKIVDFQQKITIAYPRLSPNSPLVDQVVDPTPSSVDPTLPLKSEVQVVDPTLSSVDPTIPSKSEVKVVNSIPSSIDLTLHLKSEVDTAHVFLISSDSSGLGGISPIPTEPPPSTEIISFDWNRLTRPFLPSYLPF